MLMGKKTLIAATVMWVYQMLPVLGVDMEGLPEPATVVDGLVNTALTAAIIWGRLKAKSKMWGAGE